MATLTGKLREQKVDRGKQWMQENAQKMGPLEATTLEDYTFLKHVIGNKRIVWLGENGHGVKEHTILKTKIIQYLQQELNFKVVVFQNGLMECASSEFVKENLFDKLITIASSITTQMINKINITSFISLFLSLLLINSLLSIF